MNNRNYTSWDMVSMLLGAGITPATRHAYSRYQSPTKNSGTKRRKKPLRKRNRREYKRRKHALKMRRG